MLPTSVSVKIDNPDSEFHGETGFVLHNKNSGIIEPCSEHSSVGTCQRQMCEGASELPEGWYEIVFDPMDAGGFAHCSEWFEEDNLVVNGC
jgi:hypothetical protein